ncbi:hypothetical protein D3C78_1559250 [compost metagenome]
MGCILSTEVPALYSARKTFTFGSTGNIDFFNVSEDFYADFLTCSELLTFFKAEFPQTTASFDASFSEMARFRFGHTVSFFATGSDLNGTVSVVFQVFNLSHAVRFNFNHGYWDRNAIFSEDTSHAQFLTD